MLPDPVLHLAKIALVTKKRSLANTAHISEKSNTLSKSITIPYSQKITGEWRVQQHIPQYNDNIFITQTTNVEPAL